METIIDEVIAEVARAQKLHRPMTCAHEAYAVIKEELDEFWDEVRKKKPEWANLHKELVHVAAMACRAISDISDRYM